MWEIVVEKILTPIAKSLARQFHRVIREKLDKEFSVSEISEGLEIGKLSFEKSFKVSGTFSEYVPFVDLASLVKGDIVSEISSTCRVGDIVRDGEYLGALFPLGAKSSSEPAIPLFYSSKNGPRKIFSFSTGDQIKLECQAIPLDHGFRNILYNKKNYCVNEKPFGLRVLDIYTKKSKKVAEFSIEAFFLTSLAYSAGIENLFSSLNEIADTWLAETNEPVPIFIGYALHTLTRDGLLKMTAKNKLEPIKILAHHDWIEGKLFRFSNTVDILDKESSKETITGMKEHLDDFTFIEDETQLEDWGGIKALLEGKKTENRMLANFARRVQNRTDLLKAWNFYLKPTLNVDFQFDQVRPVIRQTIDPRKILEQRGLI